MLPCSKYGVHIWGTFLSLSFLLTDFFVGNLLILFPFSSPPPPAPKFFLCDLVKGRLSFTNTDLLFKKSIDLYMLVLKVYDFSYFQLLSFSLCQAFFYGLQPNDVS